MSTLLAKYVIRLEIPERLHIDSESDDRYEAIEALYDKKETAQRDALRDIELLEAIAAIVKDHVESRTILDDVKVFCFDDSMSE
jgi:N-glycosylase/DNA lyase